MFGIGALRTLSSPVAENSVAPLPHIPASAVYISTYNTYKYSNTPPLAATHPNADYEVEFDRHNIHYFASNLFSRPSRWFSLYPRRRGYILRYSFHPLIPQFFERFLLVKLHHPSLFEIYHLLVSSHSHISQIRISICPCAKNTNPPPPLSLPLPVILFFFFSSSLPLLS